jgi:hypothetical protein
MESKHTIMSSARSIGVYAMDSESVSADSIGVYAVVPSESQAFGIHNHQADEEEVSGSVLRISEDIFCLEKLMEDAIELEEAAEDSDDDDVTAGPSSLFSHSQPGPTGISGNLLTEDDDGVAEPQSDYAVHLPRPSISHSQPSLSSYEIKRKKKNKAHSKANRRDKRGSVKMPHDVELRYKAQLKHVHLRNTIKSMFQTEKGRFSSTSYIGTNDPLAEKIRYKLKDLVGTGSRGFRLYKWDGKVAVPIFDASGRLIAVLVGCPDDENWEFVNVGAAQALEDARPQCSFSPKSLKHRRGTYPALSTGISIGNGQKTPSNLVNNDANQRVVEHLATLDPFKRLASFSTGEFVFR